METQLLNTQQAAAYINRTAHFVRYTLKHEVPHIQRGSRAALFFRRSDLDMWIASNIVAGRS